MIEQLMSDLTNRELLAEPFAELAKAVRSRLCWCPPTSLVPKVDRGTLTNHRGRAA